MNAAAKPLQPLVDAIVGARRTRAQAPREAQLEPAERRIGYATQQAVATALGESVAGWKVGMLADGTPMAAPMFTGDIRPSGATWKLPAHGVLVVEVEVALRLARDLPVRAGNAYTRDEVAAAVGEVLIGIELLASRFAGDGFPPFPLHLADNLGNAGYVIGEATRDFASLDLARLRCRYALDGVQVHDAMGGHPQGDPWLPVLACLNEGLMPLGGFRAGQVVTTGSLIKPARLDAPTQVTATIDDVGSVALTLQR
ncbi:MAG: hydratase [Betaproteobacteria bacterium]